MSTTNGDMPEDRMRVLQVLREQAVLYAYLYSLPPAQLFALGDRIIANLRKEP